VSGRKCRAKKWKKIKKRSRKKERRWRNGKKSKKRLKILEANRADLENKVKEMAERMKGKWERNYGLRKVKKNLRKVR
jgi:ribosome-binding ATPase YchF (GTP1/OBG family)